MYFTNITHEGLFSKAGRLRAHLNIGVKIGIYISNK